ncbi:MAG: hypothetical protein JWL60_94 [Gemmatimonadetes bacterium]|jgi:endoglucanase|nr:hypothetical protein [Gemmatimonadota bacterium]
MTHPTRHRAPCALPAIVALPRAIAFAMGLAACAVDAGTLAAPAATESAERGGAAVPPAATASPFAGARFFVDPQSPARRTATAWRTSRPADAAQMDKIASQPVTRWFGNWNASVRADADAATTASIAAGTLPVFVAYNIPQRDCGGMSGNNTTTVDGYRAWVSGLAEGIGARRAVILLEPDALAGMDCLDAAGQRERLDLLRWAVQTLAARGTVAVYLDAGNPRWQSASVMAGRLTGAGIGSAHGFTLNVSNFLTTSETISYGAAVSALVGGRHFVIDTGRNGAGSNGEWCNPSGRALGARPTTETGHPLVDAFLWVKAPGESDGPCNGAASSGEWMPEYALGLAQRAGY